MGQEQSHPTYAALEMAAVERVRLVISYPPAFAKFCADHYDDQTVEGWEVNTSKDSTFKHAAALLLNVPHGLPSIASHHLFIDRRGYTHKSTCLDAKEVLSVQKALQTLWSDYLAKQTPAEEPLVDPYSMYLDAQGQRLPVSGLTMQCSSMHGYRITYPAAFALWAKEHYHEKEYKVEDSHSAADGYTVGIQAGGQYKHTIFDEKLYLDERGCTQEISFCDNVERYKTVLTRLWEEFKADESAQEALKKDVLLRLE